MENNNMIITRDRIDVDLLGNVSHQNVWRHLNKEGRLDNKKKKGKGKYIFLYTLS